MANAINLSVFSAEVQAAPGFQALLAMMNLSPTEVSQLNSLPDNSIQLNPGLGTKSTGSILPVGNPPVIIPPVISIDPATLTATDPNAIATLATEVGHELGHVTQVGGFPQLYTASDPEQAAAIGNNAEGVALYNESLIAGQISVALGIPVVQGSAENSPGWIAYSNMFSSGTYSQSALIAAGAAYYGASTPSGVPFLTYTQYYEYFYAIGIAIGNGVPIVPINWAIMTPDNLVIQNAGTPNGWSISGTGVPTSNLTACSTENINYSTSGTTWSSTVDAFAINNTPLFQAITTGSVDGPTFLDISGQGAVEYINNATVNIATGGQATIIGTGDTIAFVPGTSASTPTNITINNGLSGAAANNVVIATDTAGNNTVSLNGGTPYVLATGDTVRFTAAGGVFPVGLPQIASIDLDNGNLAAAAIAANAGSGVINAFDSHPTVVQRGRIRHSQRRTVSPCRKIRHAYVGVHPATLSGRFSTGDTNSLAYLAY
jgi:hypothetical protein